MTESSQASLFSPSVEPEISSLDLMALGSIRGLGLHGIRNLVGYFRQLHLVWEASPSELEAALRPGKVTNLTEVVSKIGNLGSSLQEEGARELQRLADRGITVVTCNDPTFPSSVRTANPTVYWLFVEGAADALQINDLVGVVGTRKPSKQGKLAATRVASWLVRRDITIVSGLAEGIDAAAQQVAVDAGQPTIAVVGHGLSVVFPASTAGLRQEIVRSGGAVVTEYFSSERYERQKFVARNRIQAALSKLLVAVEAEYDSGTAHTVRFAKDYSRALIGIRTNGEVGIHRLVAELGGPIVDLRDPGASAEFAAILTRVLNRHVPEEAPMPTSQLLNRIVDDFRELVGRYPITEEDLDKLVERLRAVLNGANST